MSQKELGSYLTLRIATESIDLVTTDT